MYDFEKPIKQIKKINKINNNILNNNNSYHNEIINIIKLGFFEYDNTSIKSYKHNEYIYGSSFNSIPITIRKNIYKNKPFNVTYKFFIKNRSFQIHFISNKNINIDKNTIKMIYCILFLCNYLSHNFCCNTLNIYIYLTKNKKSLPEKFKILDREDINTAFTYSCLKDNNIYIFREEEWFKCLIHESIHAFGMDFAQSFSKEYDIYSSKIIQKIFPVNFDLNINESYVEVLSIYLNSIIKSFFSTYNKNSDNFNNKVIEKTFNLIDNEVYFSLFQSVKIFDHYDINYNLLHTNNKSVLTKYDEYTSVFSYFIIKTILLYNFNDFFSWCIKNNTNIINFDCINNNVKSKSKKNKCFSKIKSFCQLIIKNYNKKTFINDINKIHQIFIQTKTKTFVHKSLRFSIYG